MRGTLTPLYRRFLPCITFARKVMRGIKLIESAQKKWKRIIGFALLTLVVNNVEFKDGLQVEDQSESAVA